MDKVLTGLWDLHFSASLVVSPASTGSRKRMTRKLDTITPSKTFWCLSGAVSRALTGLSLQSTNQHDKSHRATSPKRRDCTHRSPGGRGEESMKKNNPSLVECPFLAANGVMPLPLPKNLNTSSAPGSSWAPGGTRISGRTFLRI